MLNISRKRNIVFKSILNDSTFFKTEHFQKINLFRFINLDCNEPTSKYLEEQGNIFFPMKSANEISLSKPPYFKDVEWCRRWI